MAQNLKKMSEPTTREQRLETYQPLSGMVVPRFAGISTFMRLPYLAPIQAPGEIDIAILGIPFDGATTNRPGTRLGPRQVREASSLMRLVNYGTLVAPYDLCACADVGDVPVNPIDVQDTLRRIEAEISYLHQGGVTPLSIGGDHIISYPILRALAAKSGPVGMIHVDAHSDTGDTYFGGQKLTHGTPFRRAIEDGVLDPRRMVQIGIRGHMYAADEREWALDQGIRIIDMEEVAEKGIPYAIAEARRIVGGDPTYFTFDIDSIDPAFAPGTGTPEIGGFTSREALQLVRGFRHLNLIGADMVEVSPPLDQSGGTALVGASIAFELLCLLAEARAERASKETRLNVV
ncbi:agmatinase [Microvirga mediterraneensis]|uniref:Agmatinase n=1 Tax=Microvirga mediterraneensis TaxID=2754695 RepID=A0A838BPP9_9HYPH|nr:agmatinase [Microvirga mediterraneensis]MBA1156882.1 agmatinase [Microvirga mediterraneensis]